MGLEPCSSGTRRQCFLLALICGCLISGVACQNNMISTMESKRVPVPTSTPITANSSLKDNEQRNQNSSATNSKDFKIRCKDATERNDQLLCDTLMPSDDREDLDTSPFPFEITYCEVDLNGDYKNELVVWESSWAGTSGGGLWVLAKNDNGYRKIFEGDMAWTPIILLPSTHHGWKDFAYLQAGGGMKPSYVAVIRNSKSYTTLGGPELTESQPAGEVLIEKNWDSSTFGPNATSDEKTPSSPMPVDR